MEIVAQRVDFVQVIVWSYVKPCRMPMRMDEMTSGLKFYKRIVVRDADISMKNTQPLYVTTVNEHTRTDMRGE